MAVPIRNWLARAGGHLSFDTLRVIKGFSKYLEVGYEMRQMGYRLNRVDWKVRREQVWDVVLSEVAARKVLFLEFGVFEGATTRYWAERLKHPESRLHGFDSFEGLPEDWHEVRFTQPKGHFSTDGSTPRIDDSRVTFFKGWFNETLPKYQLPDHEVLVVDFDADLYSSTKCVFQYIGPYIVPGSYLYFDEFSCLQDEMKAFKEYISASPYKFVLRAATLQLAGTLFQCIA
jgi:hypothetical protein